MKTIKIFLLVFSLSLLASSALSAEINLINNSGVIALDFTGPLHAMNQAKSHFEKNFGLLDQDILVSIQDAGCLRTGYDFKKKKVVFCKTKKTHNYGLSSQDVIHHELFHAFLCQKRPDLCQDGLNVAAHEALADYFSYQMISDNFFGQGYYVDVPFIREYVTSLVLGFVEEDYDIANVHCSNFIKQSVDMNEALEIFSLKVPQYFRINSLDLPFSSMSRYRLKVGGTYRFEVDTAQEQLGVIERVGLLGLTPAGLEVRIRSNQIDVKLLEKIKPSALAIGFFGSKGDLIGRKRLYLGASLN